jgi:hypothetical protein
MSDADSRILSVDLYFVSVVPGVAEEKKNKICYV